MRSKVLLITNIIVTLYVGLWIYLFGSIYAAGKIMFESVVGFREFIEVYFSMLFSLIEFIYEVGGFNTLEIAYIYGSSLLLLVHIICFVLGFLIGWCAYLRRKSGGAKFAAILYLIGIICVPIFILWGLPITIMGFSGAKKQKKINKSILNV